MRIVLSVPAFFPHSFGGGEVYVHRLARALRESGHEAIVLTARRGEARGPEHAYAYEGTPVRTFAASPESWRERYTGHGSVYTNAIRKALQELRPDVVHINGWKPACAEACRSLGVPHVTTAHHAGIACPAGTLVTPEGRVCPRPISTHACVPCASRNRRPRWAAGRALGMLPRPLYRALGRRLDGVARLSFLERGLIHPWLVDEAIGSKRSLLDDPAPIIAPSNFMRELLVRNGRSHESVPLVPHTIEPLSRTPIEALEGRPLRFGYVGRIEPLKGLATLLSALSMLRDPGRCELHVYGAPRTPWDEVHAAKTFAEYRGGARVVRHGRVDPSELSRVYASFDVLVVPSLLPEAFGLVVLEAFSAGRPAVVFPSGALPELVRDGVDGVVVPRRDAASLAVVLQSIIDAPEQVRAFADRVRVVNEMKSHVDQIVEVYERVLECQRRRSAGAGSIPAP